MTDQVRSGSLRAAATGSRGRTASSFPRSCPNSTRRIYLERKDKAGKYPATVAKIYKSDGLSWSNNFTFDFIPTEINFMPDTGELIVKSGGGASVKVDKNGKVMK